MLSKTKAIFEAKVEKNLFLVSLISTIIQDNSKRKRFFFDKKKYIYIYKKTYVNFNSNYKII